MVKGAVSVDQNEITRQVLPITYNNVCATDDNYFLLCILTVLSPRHFQPRPRRDRDSDLRDRDRDSDDRDRDSCFQNQPRPRMRPSQ